MASCNICFVSFSGQSSLNRHLRRIHDIVIPPKEDYVCEFCMKSFQVKLHLEKHLFSIHMKRGRYLAYANASFECNICSSRFCYRRNLFTHKKKSHGLTKNNVKKSLIKCPICASTCFNHNLLDRHLVDNHDFILDNEQLGFNSFEEFEAFKEKLELDTKARFSIQGRGKSTTRYFCHRSGNSTFPSGDKKRQKIRRKESYKIGATCPARITLVRHSDGLHVSVQKNHAGHDCTVEHLSLTKKERAQVAAKIEMGVSFSKIIEDVQMPPRDDVQRINLIKTRDLRNIYRDVLLRKNWKLLDNDVNSVAKWVTQQVALDENSHVLFYKTQGVEDEELKSEDFMLVLMTPLHQQIDPAEVSIVCIDSTHGATPHDFEVTSLLAIDEFGSGFPLAICLSNKINHVVMVKFFGSLPHRYDPQTFISNDEATYINAWREVMQSSPQQLLCTWHVTHDWQESLLMVQCSVRAGESEEDRSNRNKEKRDVIYKYCLTMLEELDEGKFYILLRNFLKMCSGDPDARDFGNYFKKSYAGRPQTWALGKRHGMTLDTNVFLESWHNKFQDCKNQSRVSQCVDLIMRALRGQVVDRIVKMIKGHPGHRKNKETPYAFMEANVLWTVECPYQLKGPFLLSREVATPCAGCPLQCLECSICPHRIQCTCTDCMVHGNLCKHIHACAPSIVQFVESADIPMGDELCSNNEDAFGCIPTSDSFNDSAPLESMSDERAIVTEEIARLARDEHLKTISDAGIKVLLDAFLRLKQIETANIDAIATITVSQGTYP